MRPMASAKRSATERTDSCGQSSGVGTVSVVTTWLIIGCEDSRCTARPVNRPWGAGHRGRGAAEILQLVPRNKFHDRAPGGDLVVEDDRTLTGDVAHNHVDDDLVVGLAHLGACCNRQAEQPGELRRGLGVAEVRRDDDAVGEVVGAEVIGEHADGREVIDRDGEGSRGPAARGGSSSGPGRLGSSR